MSLTTLYYMPDYIMPLAAVCHSHTAICHWLHYNIMCHTAISHYTMCHTAVSLTTLYHYVILYNAIDYIISYAIFHTAICHWLHYIIKLCHTAICHYIMCHTAVCHWLHTAVFKCILYQCEYLTRVWGCIEYIWWQWLIICHC